MIITQTPLRISFLGGGTDFPAFYQQEEGCVVSSAIDKYIYVIVKERFDSMIYVNYSRKEIVSSIDELEHELVREGMRLTDVREGVELTTLADVPSEGTGLGSSSAVTVGLLHALYTYRGQIRPAESLATEACRIELDTLGKPIGKQDQYITALGGLQMLTFRHNGTVTAVPLVLPDDGAWTLQQRLLLFYTNRTRQATSILAEQEANIPSRLGELRALRDLAKAGRDALLAGRHDEFGALLDEG